MRCWWATQCLIVMTLCLALACQTSKEQSKETKAADMSNEGPGEEAGSEGGEVADKIRSVPWSIIFGDGSANRFTFSRSSEDEPAVVVYDPVTPLESSSGTYSGGLWKESVLEAADVEQLWALAEKLEASAEAGSQRIKGTGSFSVTVDGKRRSFVLPRGAMLKEFESFAEPYRGVPKKGAVTLVGVAANAKAGALLKTGAEAVWVDMREWPSQALGKRVKVVGEWSVVEDLPVFIEKKGEPIKAGIPVPFGADLGKAAQRQVLKVQKWELAP